MIAALRAEASRRPDLALALSLGGVLVLCNLLYLPGHAALQSWRTLNNPILYADRYAYPELFPNDRIISHLRDIYPFLSIVYWAPAVLLKFFSIRPEHISFIEVAINDPLIVVAVFCLGRAFGLSRDVSVLAGLFTIASKVLSWDLGGYEYYGHDFAYSGSFFLPFAIGVLPSLIFRRYVLAVVLATITALVFAPAGALMCGVIVGVLAINRSSEWRRVAPWFVIPLVTFAWSAWIQMVIAGRIQERFTPGEDLEVVMANGHFVPLWLSGQFLAGPYLGFFLWCAMGAVAWRQWARLSAPQRLPVLILAGFIIGGALVGFGAVQFGSTFLLRLGPFRYFLLLAIVFTPLIVNELVDRIRSGDWPTRVIALLLFALLAVDRDTAWMLPITVPCVAFLALRGVLGSAAHWAGPVVAVIGVGATLDLLLRLGAAEAISRRLDATGGIAALFSEAGKRVEGSAPELLILAAVVAASAVMMRRRASTPWWPRALAIFVLACIVTRTAVNASWAATGAPSQFAEAQLWARDSTPVAAKFIVFEMEVAGAAYPSWQTLSQRSGAEMQYTHQKVYLPDRSLLEVDKAVSANYGFNPADVDGKVYPFYALDLYEKFQQFSENDFLRVARLSSSNFAVLRKPRTVAFPVAFENEMFAVYRMPAQFGDVQITPVSVGNRSIEVSWDAARAARPAYRLRVEFRDARNGQPIGSDCCVIIGSSPGTHVSRLPDGASGTILALIGLEHQSTGVRVPLQGDVSGENLAFWEYLVVD